MEKKSISKIKHKALGATLALATILGSGNIEKVNADVNPNITTESLISQYIGRDFEGDYRTYSEITNYGHYSRIETKEIILYFNGENYIKFTHSITRPGRYRNIREYDDYPRDHRHRNRDRSHRRRNRYEDRYEDRDEDRDWDRDRHRHHRYRDRDCRDGTCEHRNCWESNISRWDRECRDRGCINRAHWRGDYIDYRPGRNHVRTSHIWVTPREPFQEGNRIRDRVRERNNSVRDRIRERNNQVRDRIRGRDSRR